LSRPTAQVSHSSVALAVAVVVTSVRPAQLHVILAVSVFFPCALHVPSVVVNVSVSVELVVMVKWVLVSGGVSSVRLQPFTSTVTHLCNVTSQTATSIPSVLTVLPSRLLSQVAVNPGAPSTRFGVTSFVG